MLSEDDEYQKLPLICGSRDSNNRAEWDPLGGHNNHIWLEGFADLASNGRIVWGTWLSPTPVAEAALLLTSNGINLNADDELVMLL